MQIASPTVARIYLDDISNGSFDCVIFSAHALLKSRARSTKFYRCIRSFFSDPKDSIESREKQGEKRSPVPSMGSGERCCAAEAVREMERIAK
jgi:hypothetical protein